MDFVAIDTGIAGDRLTIELARAFKLRRAHAAGLLALTFAGMTRHAPDGHLGALLDEQIEEWAYWHGSAGQFAAFVRANLCDTNGLVTAWDRWNGKMIARANAAADRAREYREDKRRERAQNANRTRTRTQTVCEPYVEPNQTKPNQTKPTTLTTPLLPMNPAKAADRGGWPAAVAEAWTRRIGVISPGRVGKDLAPFVRLYATPDLAQRALIDAIGIYDDTCTRRSQSPKWPDFVQRVQGFVPQNQLPPKVPREAA